MIFVLLIGIGGIIYFIKTSGSDWGELAAFKQILNFVQNLNVANQISIVWTEFYHEFVKIFKIFNFDIESTSPDCLGVFL